MKVPRPRQIKQAFQGYRDVSRGGGPKRVRLRRLGRPEGLLLPTSDAEVEVKTRNGRTVKFNQPIPIPWPYAWGYRAARKLGLPLASTLDPEDLSFEFGVPAWAWPGGSGKGSSRPARAKSKRK